MKKAKTIKIWKVNHLYGKPVEFMRWLGHINYLCLIHCSLKDSLSLSCMMHTYRNVCLTGGLCVFLCALMFAQPSHAESRLTLESVLRDRGFELPSAELCDLLEELDLQAEVVDIKISYSSFCPQGLVEIRFPLNRGVQYVRYRLDNGVLVGYKLESISNAKSPILPEEKVRERCNELFSALGRNRRIGKNDIIDYKYESYIEVHLRECLHDTYRKEGAVTLDISTGKISSFQFYSELPPEEYLPLISEQEAINIAHSFFARLGYKVLSATSDKILTKPRLMLTVEDRQTMRDRYYWVITCKIRFGWGILPSWLVEEKDWFIFIDRKTGEVRDW